MPPKNKTITLILFSNNKQGMVHLAIYNCHSETELRDGCNLLPDIDLTNREVVQMVWLWSLSMQGS